MRNPISISFPSNALLLLKFIAKLTDGTDHGVGKIKTVVKIPFQWINLAFGIIVNRLATINGQSFKYLMMIVSTIGHVMFM